MDDKKNGFDLLLLKYLDGTLNPIEEEQLRKLLAEDPKQVQTLLDLATQQVVLKQALNEKGQPKPQDQLNSNPKNILFPLFTTQKVFLVLAASIALILGLFAFFYHKQEEKCANQPLITTHIEGPNTSPQEDSHSTTPKPLPIKNPEEIPSQKKPPVEIVSHSPEKEISPLPHELSRSEIPEQKSPSQEITTVPPEHQERSFPPSKEEPVPTPNEELPEIAKVQNLRGNIFALTSLTTQKPIKEGDTLLLTQGLLTQGKDSQATILFDDKTSIQLKADSKIEKITEETYLDPLTEKEIKRRRFYLSEGRLIANVSKQKTAPRKTKELEGNPWHPVSISTPEAKVDVVGTRFMVTSLNHSTQVDVAEGKVIFTSNFDGKKSIELTGGEYSIISKDQEPVIKSFVGINGVSLWFRADIGVYTDDRLDAKPNTIGGWRSCLPEQLSYQFFADSGTKLGPTLIQNGLNGFPTIHFEGNTFLNLGDNLGTSPVTIFSVFTPPNIIKTKDNSQTASQKKNKNQQSSTLTGTIYSSYQSDLDFDKGVNLNMSLNHLPQCPQIYIDESEAPKNLKRFVIGNRRVGVPSPFNGDIAEIIIYNRILSSAERDKIQWYLQNKYNISKVNGIDIEN
jgi:hypothetical protein